MEGEVWRSLLLPALPLAPIPSCPLASLLPFPHPNPLAHPIGPLPSRPSKIFLSSFYKSEKQEKMVLGEGPAQDRKRHRHAFVV